MACDVIGDSACNGYDPARFELLGCSAGLVAILDLAACNPRAESVASDRQTARLGVVSASGIAGEARLALLHLRPLATDVDVSELVLLPVNAVSVGGLPATVSLCESGNNLFLPMSSLQEPRISQIARIFSVVQFVKSVPFVVFAAESPMIR